MLGGSHVRLDPSCTIRQCRDSVVLGGPARTLLNTMARLVATVQRLHVARGQCTQHVCAGSCTFQSIGMARRQLLRWIAQPVMGRSAVRQPIADVWPTGAAAAPSGCCSCRRCCTSIDWSLRAGKLDRSWDMSRLAVVVVWEGSWLANV